MGGALHVSMMQLAAAEVHVMCHHQIQIENASSAPFIHPPTITDVDDDGDGDHHHSKIKSSSNNNRSSGTPSPRPYSLVDVARTG